MINSLTTKQINNLQSTPVLLAPTPPYGYANVVTDQGIEVQPIKMTIPSWCIYILQAVIFSAVVAIAIILFLTPNYYGL